MGRRALGLTPGQRKAATLHTTLHLALLWVWLCGVARTRHRTEKVNAVHVLRVDFMTVNKFCNVNPASRKHGTVRR